MVCCRELTAEEIRTELFEHFIRRQAVTDCWRREEGVWVIRRAPFVDDWSPEDYAFLTACLRSTVQTGGLVCGAFADGLLKGFVSVEPGLFGGEHRYLDVSSLHVSADCRGKGIGRRLFDAAKSWAAEQGARKLYFSSHSAVETQAFYRRMGCVEAKEYHRGHAEREPFDCQLECRLWETDFLFRNILPGEAGQTAEIERLCFPPHEACSGEMMAARAAAAPELFLVAEDRATGRIAGFLNGLSTEERAFRDAFFTDAGLCRPEGSRVMLLGLAVLPAYRGEGLARELMRRYADRERKNGRKELLLTCLPEKVTMYRNMGFADKGTADSAWGQEAWREMSLVL